MIGSTTSDMEHGRAAQPAGQDAPARVEAPPAAGPIVRPAISVVILSWNRLQELRKTLRRVDADPYAPREVIVVDNGSVDGSADMVRAEFPAVRLLALPKNVGIEGLNVGLRAARGDLVVLLDDDSQPDGEALGQLAQTFAADPRLGIAACQIRSPFDTRVNWPWRGEGDVPTFVGCGVGLRRAALDRAGLFDETFFIYQNEIDLAARVLEAGFTVRYFPDITFVHQVSPANRPSLRADYYDTRNLLWVVWKYFPPAQRIALSLRIVCEGVGYRLYRRDPGRAWTVARAAWDALVGRTVPLSRRVLSPETRQRVLVYIDYWYPPLGRRVLRPAR